MTSAPKDGKPLILWDGKYRFIAAWDKGFEDWVIGLKNEQPMFPERKPTHWTTLLEPPLV